MDQIQTTPEPQVQVQPPQVTPTTTATAPSPSTAPKPGTISAVMKKKIPANTINLLLLLFVSLLLLFDLGFPSVSAQWQQLRFFVSYGNSVDLLNRLLPLRVGLGFVFLWYAVDNFEHPEIFNNLANIVLKKMHLEKDKIKLYPFGYLQSAFEALVGISLVTGIFMDVGALLGSLLLFAVLFAYEEGLGSLLIRDIGLLGGTLTVFLLTIAS